jgi:hypothetical protein
LVTRKVLRAEKEKHQQADKIRAVRAEEEFSKREKEMYHFYQKERKQAEKQRTKSDRLSEQFKVKSRKTFLNRALVIVIILLALLIFAILKL